MLSNSRRCAVWAAPPLSSLICMSRLVEQQAQRLDGGYDGLAGLIGIGAQDVTTLAVDHLGLAAPETDCVVTAQRCE